MSRLLKKMQGKDMLAAMRGSDDEEDLPGMVQATSQNRKNEKKKKKKEKAASDAPAPAPKKEEEPKKPKKKKAAPKKAVQEDSDSEDIDAILNAHKKETEAKAKKKKPQGGGAAAAQTDAPSNSYHSCFEIDWSKDRLSKLLRCDGNHFNSEEELKRIFGAAAIMQERRENQGNQGRRIRQGNQRGRHPGGVRPQLATRFKECPLAQPDAEWWPRYSNPGYTAKRDDRTKEWTIEESRDCPDADRMLQMAINSMQVHAFGALLQRHPYHIPTLIAASEVATQVGQFSEASSLVDQAVYSSCMCLPGDFSLNDPFTMRTLPHDRKGNAPVYKALSMKIQNMIRRGCMRTALEWSKLLFNLDSRDPERVVLLMDYTAVKAGQWQWLLDLHAALSTPKAFDNIRDKRHLGEIARLPSLLFGTALAAKLMLNSGSASPAADSPESLKVDALLTTAIRAYPWVVPPVIANAKCTGEPGAAEAISVLDSAPAPSPRVAALVELYVERCSELWTGTLGKWLVKVARAVAAADLAPVGATEADASGVFGHYSECTVAHLMGRVDVLLEEALEDQQQQQEGLHPELDELMANFAEEEEGFGMDGGAEELQSEAVQMLSLAEIEISSLECEAEAYVSAGKIEAAEKLRLNEMITRQLLFLDEIRAEGEEADHVRAVRKELIVRCQRLCDDVDKAEAS